MTAVLTVIAISLTLTALVMGLVEYLKKTWRNIDRFDN